MLISARSSNKGEYLCVALATEVRKRKKMNSTKGYVPRFHMHLRKRQLSMDEQCHRSDGWQVDWLGSRGRVYALLLIELAQRGEMK